MSWEVRKAELKDASDIVRLARDYDEFLMPYVLNEFVVRNYIDQFMVAERVVYQPGPHYEVGGAVHFINSNVDGSNMAECDKVCSFLLSVKQVPTDIVDQFILAKGNLAFLGQVVCPEKGSFYAILEELKSGFDELWCWISYAGPSYDSYVRYGFSSSESRSFWNVYKCDYSTFVLGKWKREVSVGG